MSVDFGNDVHLVKRVALVGLAIGFVVAGGAVVAVGWPASDKVVWLLLVAFGPAVVLSVVVGITAAFRVRLSEHSIQHVVLGRFVLSEFPLVEFRSMQHMPPVLFFKGGKRMRLLGMHLGLLNELERSIQARQKSSSNPAFESGRA